MHRKWLIISETPFYTEIRVRFVETKEWEIN